MKKLFVIALLVGLVASAIGTPAIAAKKKKKPIKMTYYLHGNDVVGETYLNAEQTYMKMDSSKPTGSEPKSIFVTNYVVGPNTACSGNGLLPTWQGLVAGSMTGTLTVTLHTVSTPATKLKVEVFPDGTGGCDGGALGNSGYVPPAAVSSVDVAPGPAETKVVFKNVKFKTLGHMLLQLSIDPAPLPTGPQQVRVLYDTADFASSVAFSCTPKGKKCA
jgi:hypothetical protein